MPVAADQNFRRRRGGEPVNQGRESVRPKRCRELENPCMAVFFSQIAAFFFYVVTYTKSTHGSRGYLSR